MKYSKENSPSGMLVPLECNNPNILMKGDKNVAAARVLQKERRKNKRREKENMWKRNNQRNAMQEPIVMHYPARSALQTLHKSSARAQDAHYFQGGINHDWVCYYERGVTSDQSCINEWNVMDSLESKRPPSPDYLTDKEETQLLIRSKLKEIMMSVDIDEVTSKYIRQRLEEDLAMNLFKFKSYIDQEMLVILGQMDAATEIFPHVYLGSEWNASNLEELQSNGVGYILNVTKEIDNFYPGTFDYLNIRVYDDEKTELLRHWDRTFRYITQVKEKDSKVLVHCKMGISRSASVVIAYAMKAFNMSLDDALALVKKKRSCIKPNQAFCSQLKTYEGILDASRQRHNILWRSKSETNLKSASGQTNRHNKREQNAKSNDRVDQSNNNRNMRKSSEELSTLDPSYNNLHVHIPTPSNLQNGGENRRPKSWSPDDHTAALLFPQNTENGGNDFGESWRLSQSLNVQSWQAHVTLQHRDHRELTVESSGDEDRDESPPSVVEALNPLYSEIPTDGITNEVSSLQFSTTVKDIINEFENVQTGNHTVSKKGDSGKKAEAVLIQNTLSSSDDFENHSSTAELDRVIETLLTTGEDVQGSEPVVSQTKAAAQKHQAVLIPSQVWQDDKSEVETNATSTESPGGVLKEPIMWPAGIVKKQKQDFEEKVKMSDSKSPSSNKDSEPSLSRQNSSSSLTGHIQKVEVVRSPSYGRQDSLGSDTVKKDDYFSAKLDKVFDREEKKQQRLSAIIPISGDSKETPSRNSSWGSFDSAVVLADRDLPSRQSSWGSCDTRITASSRNSSFGAFDKKPPPLRENLEILVPDSNITGTYFEKDPGPFSPGTIRRNKNRNPDLKDGLLDEDTKSHPSETEDSEEIKMEDGSQFKPVANIKAYGPAPYKSPTERESSTTPMELADEGMVEASDSSFDHHHHSNPSLSICIPNSTNTLAITRSQPNICTTTSPDEDFRSSNTELNMATRLNGSKTSPVSESIPAPGIVKQHKEILESKTQEGSSTEVQKVHEKLSPPTYTRSHSYCDLEIEKSEVNLAGPVSHNFSEKRAKFEGLVDCESEKGKVRKITQAIEKHKDDEEMKQCKIKGIRKRSHSLERLSTSPSSPGSSQIGLLEQLLVQTQADTQQLETQESPAEEICVKNLVGKFEDCQEQKPPKVQTRSVRAKSDSCTPDKFLPPVPQRKSSLDYNFKPVHRSQSQPPQTPVRQMTPGGSLSPMEKVPSHKPPPSGRGQACGTEVRQKKQQGKTHPLTKLTRARENYHTM